MCDRLLASFPTSLEQDKELWKAGQFKSTNQKSALLIRGRAKEILQALKDLIVERWLSFLLKNEESPTNNGSDNNKSEQEQQQQQQEASADHVAAAPPVEEKKEEAPSALPPAAQQQQEAEAEPQKEVPLA